jgi:PAS domain-containing protein
MLGISACLRSPVSRPRPPPRPQRRGILESAVTAIITIDHRGLIESINPATEPLFGYGA